MRGGVDLLELGDADLGVDGGGGQTAVAEDLLDEAHVGAALEHLRRHRVAEDVARAGLAEVGALHVAGDEVADPAQAERLASPGEKQAPLASGPEQIRPGLLDVLLDPGQGALADGHAAILVALALAHEDHAAAGVEVGERERDQLGPAGAGRVEGFQPRPVAQPEGRLHVGQREDLLDLGVREHDLGSRVPTFGYSTSEAGLKRRRLFLASHLKKSLTAPSFIFCVPKSSGSPLSLR